MLKIITLAPYIFVLNTSSHVMHFTLVPVNVEEILKNCDLVKVLWIIEFLKIYP